MSSNTPSAPEVLSLLSLIPATSPNPLDVSALLQPLLDPLCTPSLLNFLLHPTLHLTPFLSPSLSTLSLTTAFSITRITPPTLLPSPYPSDSHHLSGHYLFLPTLTTPTFTLGHAHVEILAQLGRFWQHPLPPCATSLPFHFLLHHPTHTLLLIMDHPNIHRLYLHSFTLHSPTLTSSTFAEFHRPTLLKLLHRHTSHSPPPAPHLESALFFIQHEPHRRSCPQCLAPPTTPCPCPLHPPPPPAHTFDLNFFHNAMSMYTGIFHTVATKRVFNPHPGGPRLYMQATRMTMRRCTNPPFVRRVVDWAAMHFRQLRSETPRLALPLQWYGDNCADMYNPRKVAREYGVPEQVVQGLDIANLLDGNDHGRETTEQWLDSMIRADEMDKPVTAVGAVDWDGRSDDAALLQDLTQDLGCASGDATSAGVASEKEAGNADLVDPATDTNAGDGLFSLEDSASEMFQMPDPPLTVGETCTVQIATQDFPLPVENEGTQAQTPPNTESRAVDREGPATATVVENTSSQTQERSSQAQEDVKARDRIEKIRLRRERNRACARRSNLRAKKEREQLLADIQAAQKKVSELRGHEIVLRKENLTLRRLLADSTLTGPSHNTSQASC